MKITYERLNQIIEEEVVKFKNLNESFPSTDLNDAITNLKAAIATQPEKTKELIAKLDVLTTQYKKGS
jgi:hypothetical protein